MKRLLIVAAALFSLAPLAAAGQVPQLDYDVNQERMIIEGDDIFITSSFQEQDIIALYHFNGQREWEARFHARIISWSVQRDVVIVLSKGRTGEKTYLTCLDRETGRRLWEKP